MLVDFAFTLFFNCLEYFNENGPCLHCKIMEKYGTTIPLAKNIILKDSFLNCK